MDKEAFDRFCELLKDELKSTELRKWYYVLAEIYGDYQTAAIVMAHGPTDAWRLFHDFRWYPYGTTAVTHTQLLSEGKMEKIDESYRWRQLTHEEVMHLYELTNTIE